MLGFVKKILKWGGRSIISVIILKLIGGGINTLFIEWVNAASIHKANTIILDRCERDTENAHVFRDACSNARFEITKYPISVAITKLIEQTPSCIEFDCIDLLALIFNSWIAIIFTAVLALSLAFFMTRKSWRWTENYIYERKMRGYEKIREDAGTSYYLPVAPNDVTVFDLDSKFTAPQIDDTHYNQDFNSEGTATFEFKKKESPFPTKSKGSPSYAKYGALIQNDRKSNPYTTIRLDETRVEVE